MKNNRQSVPAAHAAAIARGARRWGQWLLLIGALAGLNWVASAPTLPAVVDLNSPPTAAQEEPSNVALALSVEFPTVGAAYRSGTYVHDPDNAPYLGYWDPKACYRYKETGAAELSGEYFYRIGATDGSGYCTDAYSGNLLNFAASSAIDILRLSLTGGHRVVDTTSKTVLERAYLYRNWKLNDPTYFPARQIPIALVGRVMPADANPLPNAQFVYSGSCKNFVWFGRRTANNVDCDTAETSATTNVTVPAAVADTTCQWPNPSGGWYCTSNAGHDNQNGVGTCGAQVRVRLGGSNRNVYPCTTNLKSGTRQESQTTYTYYGDLNPLGSNGKYQPMYARVRVCDGLEPSRPEFCQRYPLGNHKPVGEIQMNSDGTRISAFGYLAEDGTGRYGGVLRAPMSYVGPTKPASGTAGLVSNPQAEWNLNTGVFVDNPRNGSFTYSGVVNYVNRFGTTGTPGYYKGNDPVGELYYETLRYFMGLGPSADAISNLQTSSYDGFPVYTQASDPIENACQRKNYILTIGDVNTHADRQLPGHGGTGAIAGNGTDPARGAESLLGGGSFNAASWTAVIANMETDSAGTYTNSLGASVSTRGNPNPNANNSSLNNKATGSGGSSAYYWAGAAYWAHTQPIRNDNDAQGKSKSLVRVNTFTIDVDEGGNGTIDASPRGIKPRQSSFYLAGKYGWFNNTNTNGGQLQPLPSGALGANEHLDGHPFRNVLTGALDNSRWEYAGEPNTPDGYVIASQAAKLQAGISRFFSSLRSQVTPGTVTGLSALRFTSASPDGDMFIPQYDPKNWAGRLVKGRIRFDVNTGSLALTSVSWDAGKILTDASVATGTVSDPMVKPASRKIFTYSRDGTNRGGQLFTTGSKDKFDTEVVTALTQSPSGAPAGQSDGDKQDAIIDWLRGDRSLEAGATGGYLRARTSVLGDIVNSGPVYKKEADPDVSGTDYATFASTARNRTAMVYVGANDGLLHAFRASDGKELFAYLPRAVATKAPLLALPDYTHLPFVDAMPAVEEAQLTASDGTTTWKTVLVSGMGGGAQGIFALDVTDPDAFDKSKVMFEFTDADDVDMGNVIGQPKLVRIKQAGAAATAPQYRWYVAVSSGYNNYQADGAASTDGRQALFLLSLDKPAGDAWVLGTNYFKMKVATPSSARAAALANPGVAKDVFGNAVLFYAGDTQGNLWKFDLQNGLNSTNAANAVKSSGTTPVPMAVLRDSSTRVQPITTVPQVVPGLGSGYMVIFGTGKFLESGDAANTETNAVYGIWDNLTNDVSDWQVGRAKLFGRSFDAGTNLTSGDATFEFGTGSSGTYRGWYVTLPLAGERVVVDPDTRFGYTAVNSLVPPADCTVRGSGATMTFGNLYGNAESARNYQTSGYLGRPRIVQIDLSPVDTYTYSTRTGTGRRDISISSLPISSTGGAGDDPTLISGSRVTIKVPAGRVGWREIKNFGG